MNPTDEDYVDACKAIYNSRFPDGDLDFDDHPLVSTTTEMNGAYVQCWLWVTREEARTVAGYQ